MSDSEGVEKHEKAQPVQGVVKAKFFIEKTRVM